MFTFMALYGYHPSSITSPLRGKAKVLVFVNGFLILVKELGLLTNLGQWIRVLDASGSIYIFYCKK
jgi:hypothetical protein